MLPKLLPALFVVTLAVAPGCTDVSSALQSAADQKKASATPAPAAAQKPSRCVRGEPEALLASQSIFKRTARGEAQEIVQGNAPIQITIRHFGCAHYALDFEFKFPGRQMPDPQVSLKEAAAALEKLPVKKSNLQAIKGIVEAMRKMAADPYKQPLTMSENETLGATTPALNILRVRYDVVL